WQQIERVRITPQPLSVDEMSKLWTTFQTQYRISMAYEVAVVLIESRRAVPRPLPVLTRGPGDAGVPAQADLVPPFPTIESVTIDAIKVPAQDVGARLGDTLDIAGHHLGGASLARFANDLAGSIDVALAAGGTPQQVQVQIPNVPASWRA